MNDYIFWQDFFDTYQSFPDWLKAFWGLVVLLIALGLPALFMLYRWARKRSEVFGGGKLVYSVTADPDGNLNIVTHDDAALPPPPLVGARLAPTEHEKHWAYDEESPPARPTAADLILRAEAMPFASEPEEPPPHGEPKPPRE